MADDKGSRRDRESSDFSSLFESYSGGLNKSSAALSDAAKSFDRSSGKISDATDDLSKTFHKDVDRLVRVFSKFSSDFDSSLDKESSDRSDNSEEEKKYLEKNVKDMSGQFERAFGKSKNSYVNAAISSLKTVFNFAIRQFTDAFNKVVDNYNANFTAITSRQQLAASDYTKALQGVTDKIISDKFRTQFTQIDWASQLIPVLETGIRGGLADQMAYQNMITSRLLPMINTNTKAYTRMSKTFGDTFTEAVNSIGTYTEKLYGAEGLEEGQFENLLQSTYREIMTAVREQGGTGEDVARIMQSFTGTYQEYAARYGSEVATNMLSDFVDAATNTVAGDNLMALMAASDSGIVGGNLSKLGEDTLLKFFSSEASNYRDLMSDSQYAIALTSQAGLGNLQTAEDINNYDYFGSSVQGFDINNFNSQQQKDENWRKLQNGYYVSITEQMDNWNINAVAKTADKLAETIPHTTEVLGMIFDIVKNFFIAWLGSRGVESLTGGKGLGSLFKSGGGKGLRGLLSAGKGASLFNGGATMSTYLAGAAGIGGLVWGGVDAYKGIQASKARGDSTLGVIGQGARSFLTGRYAMSASEEAGAVSNAFMGQERSIDWGSALKNTGKGALIGAGASSVIPGLGTVVGTIAGGLIGGITNLIDQYVENKKYNRLADASNAVSDSLENLSATTANFNKVVEKERNLQKALNILNDEYYDSQGNLIQATEDEKQSALDYIKEQYPMIKSVKELKDWDEQYTEIVEKKVGAEKTRAALEALGAADEVFNNISERNNAYEDLVTGGKYINPQVRAFAKAVVDAGGEDSYLRNDQEAFTSLVRQYARNSGLSEEEFISQTNSLVSGGLISEDSSAGYGNKYKIKTGTSGDNFKEAVEDYDSEGFRTNLSSEEKGQLRSQQDDYFFQRLREIEEAYAALCSVAEGYLMTDSEGNLVPIGNMTESVRRKLKTDYDLFGDAIDEYNRDIAGYYGQKEFNASRIVFNGSYFDPFQNKRINADNTYDESAFDALGLTYKGYSERRYSYGTYGEDEDPEATHIPGVMIEDETTGYKYIIDYPVRGRMWGMGGGNKLATNYAAEYATGLSRVPYDEFPAFLHENEMVLTSSQADALRSLAKEENTNISGLFSSHLMSKSKAVNANFDASIIYYPIVDAIRSQTIEVVGVLTNIYDLVGRIVPELRSSGNQNYSYSSSVLSYEGV